MRSFLAFFLALFAGVSTLRAQSVTVAPPVVVIDHRTRGGSVDLFNASPNPAEVSISLLYGYPETDSVGAVTLRTFDTPPAGEPAASTWIDVYPRRMTILPGQRQTVRFLARPPADLADREYWSRIVVSSKGAALSLAAPDTSNITATLNVELRTVTTLLYRKGAVSTSVATRGLHTEIRNDSLFARMRLEPGGNAAWLGTVFGTLVGTDGKTMATFERPMGIYHPIEPGFSTPIDLVPPGRYRLRVELRSARQDLSRQTVLQTPVVRDSVDVDVPPRRP